MITALLDSSFRQYIVPVVGFSIAWIPIAWFIISRCIWRGKYKVRAFYRSMKQLKDRGEKITTISNFLQYCISVRLLRQSRTCPVCGKSFRAVETEIITDENGDESTNTIIKDTCPRCSVRLSASAYDYQIEKTNENMKKKYEEKYDLLAKYIEIYRPKPDYRNPDSAEDGSDMYDWLLK